VVEKWIQGAHPKKGALHRQLGIAEGRHITDKFLKEIVQTPIGNKARGRTVTPLLKKRVNFAFNVRK
jgi:hypothetical protein